MNIVNIGYNSTNYYVLSDTKPRLLIDAGWPGTLTKFQHQAKRMGVQLEAVPYVLATHYHPDHAGLAQDLKNLGCRLIVVDLQTSALKDLAALTKPEDHFVPINAVDNVVLKLHESRAFLAKIGVSGTILHTPGHSDDSVSLVLDEGIAFTGDLTHPMMAEDNLAQASWAALRASGVKTVYAGHGPVWQVR